MNAQTIESALAVAFLALLVLLMAVVLIQHGRQKLEQVAGDTYTPLARKELPWVVFAGGNYVYLEANENVRAARPDWPYQALLATHEDYRHGRVPKALRVGWDGLIYSPAGHELGSTKELTPMGLIDLELAEDFAQNVMAAVNRDAPPPPPDGRPSLRRLK